MSKTRCAGRKKLLCQLVVELICGDQIANVNFSRNTVKIIKQTITSDIGNKDNIGNEDKYLKILYVQTTVETNAIKANHSLENPSHQPSENRP